MKHWLKVWLLVVGLMATPLADSFMLRLSALAGLVALGLASFVLLVFLLGAAQWRDVLRRLKR